MRDYPKDMMFKAKMKGKNQELYLKYTGNKKLLTTLKFTYMSIYLLTLFFSLSIYKLRLSYHLHPYAQK